jgi:hypothetical protein
VTGARPLFVATFFTVATGVEDQERKLRRYMHGNTQTQDQTLEAAASGEVEPHQAHACQEGYRETARKKGRSTVSEPGR